ncbi:MAG TPA: arsenite S-adenosylmethyltransferase [Eggerthellaceae bacterium]|nr:arsenite S-adenosylmethyltransferase [Eggerthellaceae bacterium]
MTQDAVRGHYAEVARMVSEAEIDENSGFRIVRETRSACSLEDRSEAFDIYERRLVEGIPQRALIASRGCGDPVSRAELQPGETVIDLGCGGGVDAIIASRLVGDEGHVYGLDMTPEMIRLAADNAEAAGARNITYIEGRIESIPLPDAAVDVVLSNCVINFSDDRPAALREAARVLRPGGRLVVSDIVEFSAVPADAREDLCAIAGTTNGMPAADEYAYLLEAAGFASAIIEPKTVYTRDVLRQKAERKERMEQFERIANADIDAKTGSVIIVAEK